MVALNHIALLVSNLETSKKFYKKTLELDVVFEQPISGEQFERVTGIDEFDVVFAVLSDKKSKVNIEIVEFKNGLMESPSLFNHIAFEVEDVDALYQKLVNNCIETISEPVTLSYPHPKINGKRFFYFYDPDGNIIEVFNKKEGLYSE
ncbi:MAG: fosfomycin resistance protein FosB [Candidatus Methanofastidiosum methylothiophilum]|jgi:catechol 2,3-dioxygenase-like lactoylglutathione lyase family enzyme|uniref:Fosfomycin resistance protein FosB n=1 Tax=Candidatus Methanofastidiosum methylothiophilum TaxID=1705564 RepID=A0A150JKS4_9EURY|nr:MAG: fosfomycin resistance protein FosB [Candidatus Methanofastidiosum methylthiophilus]KYC55750.1 MAG: fosfomycin resistance protein FosB [Candidatus Methanofastidiosum methylthiophilus]KYC57806.1 MAG: fosfomycin resistance protein FosB [Candidatus Methanofastidiosum methylthiophilus]OQC50603.1 MAG: fosfomycin resistance protein FosB [Euryarchaeota archaeon ADurb.Bin023]